MDPRYCDTFLPLSVPVFLPVHCWGARQGRQRGAEAVAQREGTLLFQGLTCFCCVGVPVSVLAFIACFPPPFYHFCMLLCIHPASLLVILHVQLNLSIMYFGVDRWCSFLNGPQVAAHSHPSTPKLCLVCGARSHVGHFLAWSD